MRLPWQRVPSKRNKEGSLAPSADPSPGGFCTQPQPLSPPPSLDGRCQDPEHTPHPTPPQQPSEELKTGIQGGPVPNARGQMVEFPAQADHSGDRGTSAPCLTIGSQRGRQALRNLRLAPQLPLLPTVHCVHPFHLTWCDPACQAAARSKARLGAQARLFGRSPEDRACFFLSVLSASWSGPESRELRLSVAQP